MIAVAVTIPEIGKTRRFVSPNEAHMQATLAKSCYGDPATRTVVTSEVDQRPERTALAWAAARDCIESQFDSYSQISATNLRMDPNCPWWRGERITAVMVWISAVWAHYGAVKASIQAGNDVTFDPAAPGPCPWSIWQIAADSP